MSWRFFFSFEKDLSDSMKLLWVASHAFYWTLDKARKNCGIFFFFLLDCERHCFMMQKLFCMTYLKLWEKSLSVLVFHIKYCSSHVVLSAYPSGKREYKNEKLPFKIFRTIKVFCVHLFLSCWLTISVNSTKNVKLAFFFFNVML